MKSMKLSGLNALVAAVETGSLRSGARRLGVSQPAMTKALKELERDVSATLLQRSNTGVEPTAQGKVLYEHACTVNRELASARQTIAQLGGRMTGQLNVGAVPLALLMLVPETMRTFGRAYPDIRLNLREELYVAQLTLLRAGEVDVMLGPIPDSLPHGEFHIEPLTPIQMAVVVGKHNPLAKHRSLRELTDARWVFTSQSGNTGYAKLLFEQHGLVPPEPAALVNSTLGLMSLIAASDFVGLMPMPIATHPASALFTTIIPIREGHLELNLGAIVRKDALLKPSIKHFLTHVARAAHHLGGSPLQARPQGAASMRKSNSS